MSRALVLALMMSGCSFVWTEKMHRPQPAVGNLSPDPPPVCSISYAPPMVDFAVAAASFMMSIYYVYNAALESDWARSDLAWAGGSFGVGALFATSGVVGQSRVRECRDWFSIHP